MSWRGLGVLLLLAAVGVTVGLAVGFQQRPSVATGGTAEPLPATSPSVPMDPPPSIAPDPDFPPMATGLPTHEERVGDRAFGVVVPVPDGWDKFQLGSAEYRWTPPGNPDHSYSVRVENVFSQRLSIEQIMGDRIEAVSQLPGYELESQNSDTMVFRYVDETSHERLQMLRWIAPRGSGTAEAEISVVGREADRAGMRDMLDVITNGARLPGR
jgi:hypothetical protein